MNLEITFHLDGSGIYYDPNEPVMLDSLLAWALAPKQGLRHLERQDVPDDVRLPLKRLDIGETWIWRASAIFPDGPQGEGIWYWRKRFRQSRAELTTGSPNLTNGTYRDWQMPVPLLLCHRMKAWANGSGHQVRKALREVRYLGKKSAHGHGKVLSVEVQECERDHSLRRSGRATRWIPDPNGTRFVRPRPPYWHPHGRVQCIEIGANGAPARQSK